MRVERQVNVTFKEAMHSSTPLIGTLLTTASPEIAEALALIGFDWIFIDLEHGSISFREAQAAIQAISNRCFTLIRVSDATPENVKRALDTGCTGIIVPLVNSASVARRLMSLSKYPPVGERSVGLGRAQGFGLRFSEYLEQANECTAVVVQIEHKDAVREVNEILAVTGIDAALVGPYDLSGSMGLLGQVTHADVTAAVTSVRNACFRAQVPFGIYCGTSDQANLQIKMGAKLIAIGTDILHMASAGKAVLAAVRDNISS